MLERLSAEGVFFHRQCFVCSNCNLTLRVGAYLYDEDAGDYLFYTLFCVRSNCIVGELEIFDHSSYVGLYPFMNA